MKCQCQRSIPKGSLRLLLKRRRGRLFFQNVGLVILHTKIRMIASISVIILSLNHLAKCAPLFRRKEFFMMKDEHRESYNLNQNIVPVSPIRAILRSNESKPERVFSLFVKPRVNGKATKFECHTPLKDLDAVLSGIYDILSIPLRGGMNLCICGRLT